MLNKVKTWIHSKRLMSNDITVSGIPTAQEDTKSIEAVKRVRKMFEQQEASMNIRSLKRHSCANPDLCTKIRCFKSEPDKIIHTETVERKTIEELTHGIKNKRSADTIINNF